MARVRFRSGQRHPVRGNGSDNLATKTILRTQDPGTRPGARDLDCSLTSHVYALSLPLPG